jgi:orotidine-5'-phosphate decarboxylase
MSAALKKLIDAQQRTGSLLSIGLEPSFEYLPDGFPRNLQGLWDFMEIIVRATDGLACAYKFNLAFFESHGWEGVEFLHGLRETLPPDVLIIADAKRGDIGSTAKHYAMAVYDRLQADSVTLNPLMGFDSAEPFLQYADRLNFFLVATSNPGARDFLLVNDLYKQIATKVTEWNKAGNCGFVVGATRPEQFTELRAIAPTVPFLVPGIGAQGGELAKVLSLGGAKADWSGLVLHVTRGILPGKDEQGDLEEIIRKKTEQWRDNVAACRPRGA